MARKASLIGIAILGGLAALAGCRAYQEPAFRDSQIHYQTMATQIEYADVEVEHREGVRETAPPHTVLETGRTEGWPLRLEDAVRIALANSKVMRDIGGSVLNTPMASVTVYDAAARETDPRGGTEAALSAFDAVFATGIAWGQVDRWFNNIFLTGSREFHLDYARFQAEISKTAATGTQFSLSNSTNYIRDNAPLKEFPFTYDTLFEATVRHPLLQGCGLEFNRIAGPQGKPGLYNGVLIARINTDVSLADFEIAVRDLLQNVERSYWELYYAYRDLDARRAGRDAALQTWQVVQRKFQAGTVDREQEARAREQYYLFDIQAINALSGVAPSQQPGGMAGSLASGAASGVYSAERRLRWQLGLPASDGRLIRPADEPSTVPIVFDWRQSLEESLARRPELRRQKWTIKRRELELIAARNFLQMRLDLVGKYGLRGTGNDLFGDSDVPHGSAFEDLLQNPSPAWQVGLQLATPIGNRIGHTAVANAQFLLARERAIYREQELRVSHELSDSIGELHRAYASARSLFNGRLAAHQQLDEIRKKYDSGWAPLEFLLDAQRRAVEADASFYRALVDYNLAVLTIHRARGSLMDYHSVYLSEGPWSEEARASAAKQSRRFRPRLLDYCLVEPCPISRGPCPQPVVAPQPAVPPPTEQPLSPFQEVRQGSPAP